MLPAVYFTRINKLPPRNDCFLLSDINDTRARLGRNTAVEQVLRRLFIQVA